MLICSRLVSCSYNAIHTGEKAKIIRKIPPDDCALRVALASVYC